MLIQIHINYKLIQKFLGGSSQKWVWPLWSQDTKIGCIFAQIPYLGKIWFRGMDRNAFNQSDCSIFQLTISLEQNDEKA